MWRVRQLSDTNDDRGGANGDSRDPVLRCRGKLRPSRRRERSLRIEAPPSPRHSRLRWRRFADRHRRGAARRRAAECQSRSRRRRFVATIGRPPSPTSTMPGSLGGTPTAAVVPARRRRGISLVQPRRDIRRGRARGSARARRARARRARARARAIVVARSVSLRIVGISIRVLAGRMRIVGPIIVDSQCMLSSRFECVGNR